MSRHSYLRDDFCKTHGGGGGDVLRPLGVQPAKCEARALHGPDGIMISNNHLQWSHPTPESFFVTLHYVWGSAHDFGRSDFGMSLLRGEITSGLAEVRDSTAPIGTVPTYAAWRGGAYFSLKDFAHAVGDTITITLTCVEQTNLALCPIKALPRSY